jgi:hypothetical protein
MRAPTFGLSTTPVEDIKSELRLQLERDLLALVYRSTPLELPIVYLAQADLLRAQAVLRASPKGGRTYAARGVRGVCLRSPVGNGR